MIYTFGTTTRYDEALLRPEGAVKGGPSEFDDCYPGGSCFLTVEETRAWIEKNGWEGYSVYALDGTIADMGEVGEDGVRRIIRDLLILHKVTE